MNEILRELLASGVTPLESGETVPLHSGLGHAEVAMIDRAIEDVKPSASLEVGLAYGISALAICSALERCGGGEHTVIDPNQHEGPWGDSWRGGGLHNLRRAGFRDMVTFYEQPSYSVLPELERQGLRIQFALIDGWCTFDYRLVDFVLIDRILDIGGIVLISVTDLPGVRKACRFIATNRSYSVYEASSIPHDEDWSRPAAQPRGLDVPEAVRRHFKPELREPDEELGLGSGSTAVAFRKESEDHRRWDYFEEF